MKTILKTIALSLIISFGISNSSMAEKRELTEEGFAKYVVKVRSISKRLQSSAHR